MAGKSAMRGKTEAVPRSTKATKRLSVDELVAFMSLPIFYELRTAVDVGILLFDDLDEYDLPEGYSKEDIWRILLAVRKQAAVFVPEDPERTADMWMVTTSSLSSTPRCWRCARRRTPRWRDRLGICKALLS